MSPTREERTEAKRERVLDAAQQVFMQHGFEGASMEAIALTAAVSKPTLYRYYPNKEGLFIAVLERVALEPLSDEALRASRDLAIDSPAALEEALNAWAQVALAHVIQPAYLGLIRLLIAELPRFPALGEMFAAVAQQGGVHLMAVLEDARQRGVVVVDDLEPVIRLLVSAVVYYVLSGLFASGEPRLPPPEQVAAQLHLIVAAITTPTE